MRDAQPDPSDEGMWRARRVAREMSVMEQHICVLQLGAVNMADYERAALAVLQLQINHLRVELLRIAGQDLPGNNPNRPN